jgi:hypothetical protein
VVRRSRFLGAEIGSCAGGVSIRRAHARGEGCFGFRGRIGLAGDAGEE